MRYFTAPLYASKTISAKWVTLESVKYRLDELVLLGFKMNVSSYHLNLPPHKTLTKTFSQKTKSKSGVKINTGRKGCIHWLWGLSEFHLVTGGWLGAKFAP